MGLSRHTGNVGLCRNCYLEESEIVTMVIFATEAENCAAGVRGLPSALRAALAHR